MCVCLVYIILCGGMEGVYVEGVCGVCICSMCVVCVFLCVFWGWEAALEGFMGEEEPAK